MPARDANADLGVQYLENKLTLLRGGAGAGRRNAALDLLTGREAANPVASQRPVAMPRRPAESGRHGWIRRRRWAVGVKALALVLVLGGVLVLARPAAPVETIRIEAPAPHVTVPAAAREPSTATTPRAATPAPTLAPQPAVTLRVLVDDPFGASHMLATREPGRFVALGIPGATPLGDAVVTAAFHKTGGPPGGGYGLILRARDADALDGASQLGHYYVFEVGDRGEIGVWLRDGDRWVDLLSWSASEAVRPGAATNELTVSAVGDQLSLLVNGTPIASQVDTTLHAGAAGVFVGGDGNQVTLEHLTVRVPR
jgi:hypothetical protein